MNLDRYMKRSCHALAGGRSAFGRRKSRPARLLSTRRRQKDCSIAVVQNPTSGHSGQRPSPGLLVISAKAEAT